MRLQPHELQQLLQHTQRFKQQLEQCQQPTGRENNINSREGQRRVDVRKTEMISSKAKQPNKRSLERDDDDIVEIGEVKLSEASFKCPYSTLKFKKAMKNSRKAGCKHRLDISSVDAMSQAVGGLCFDCPIPGCLQKWTKCEAKEDEEFMMQIKRFDKENKSEIENKKAKKSEVIVIDD